MNLLTAIVVCNVDQVNGNKFLKYRNISDTALHRERFMRFAAKFPGAQYVNWYDKHTKQFLGRMRIA